MMRLTMACCGVASVLVVAGCSGSSSDGGTGSPSGGTSQTSGGTGSAAGGTSSTGGAGSPSGGTTGSTGGAFTSSVSSTKVLGTLSDADANTLCMDLGNSAAFKSINTFSCSTSALLAAFLAPDQSDAGIQAACKSSYDSCVADAGTSMLMCDSKPTSSCMATVGEYEKCLNDEAALIQSVSAQIPACKDLTAATLQSSTGGLTTQMDPASCTTLQAKCPEVGAGM